MLFWNIVIYAIFALSRPSSAADLSLLGDTKLYFDADTTEFDREGKSQRFRGDVVIVGSGIILTADSVTMNREEQMVVADGHVVVLSEKQIFVGEQVRYNLKNGDMFLLNAALIANDPEKAVEVSRRILGFTPLELAFDEQKAKRLAVIEQRKEKLRQQYADQQKSTTNGDASIVDQYALLLEQQELSANQENPFLARMSPDRRKRYKDRRQYWEQQRLQLAETRTVVSAFFRVDGRQIVRQRGNDYRIDDGFWSPCNCEDDESPAWGFRSAHIDGQMEGYLDFYHPVLEIKGIPVLYLPFLKVPLKEKRQTGFLMPTFGHRADSGNIYSQPIYFAWSDSADSTLNVDLYEKRGLKLGAETRIQQRKYSGWTLQLEGIRDRKWMQERLVRKQVAERLFENEGELIRSQCAESSGGNPDAEAQCVRLARQRLQIPENDWRGSQKWQGLTILAPRLSVVSSGTLYSDHRFVEDLTLFKDFQSALDGSSRANMFSTSRYQAHLDAKNFYWGVGGALGDSVLSNYRFQGQQMPLQTSFASRMIRFDRGLSPVPVYAQLAGQHFQIRDFVGPVETQPELEGRDRTLGSGYWQRLKIDQVSPLVSSSIIKVDQFADAEVRVIGHEGLSDAESHIRSWRTGVTFNLPIDGEGQFDGFMVDGPETSFGKRFIRHYMNWSLSLSARPEVYRTGVYGQAKSRYFSNQQYVEGPDLVYFASDRLANNLYDTDIDNRDSMITHRKLTLGTQHTWDTFDRGWERQPGAQPPTTEPDEQTFRERALKELNSFSDRPVKGDLFEKGQWLIDRFALVEKNKNRFASLNADVSYDWEEADRREEMIEQREDGEIEDTGEFGLPQPWSTPRVDLGLSGWGTSLNNEVRYNIYFKKVTEQKFRLSFPSFWLSNIAVGYNIGNEPKYIKESGNLAFILTREFYAALSTSLIPHTAISAWLGKRVRDYQQLETADSQNNQEYQTVYQISYLSPTDCWRLDFQRQKKYVALEQDAEYLLEFSFVFMGRTRPTRDISPGLVRELPGSHKRRS